MNVKTGIITTLIKRSEQICNTTEAADHERRCLIQEFQSNGYWIAFIQRAMNPKRTYSKDKQAAQLATISIPYIKGTSERIRLCLSWVDIWVAFRNRTTMRSLLMSQTATIPNGIQRADLRNTMPQLWSSLHRGDREASDHKTKRTAETRQVWKYR